MHVEGSELTQANGIERLDGEHYFFSDLSFASRLACRSASQRESVQDRVVPSKWFRCMRFRIFQRRVGMQALGPRLLLGLSRPCLLHADCRWRDRLISLLLAYWLMALTDVRKNTRQVIASVHRQEQRATRARVWGTFSPDNFPHRSIRNL